MLAVMNLAFFALSAAMSKVEVYTTPGCRYCTKAKSFLKKRLVDGFVELDVSEKEEATRNILRSLSGTSTSSA